MKQLIIRYCVVVGIAVMCASFARAQSIHSPSITGLEAGAPMIGTEIHLGSGAATSVTHSRVKPGNSLFNPLDAAPFQLSYCDTTVDSFEWIGGGRYASLIFFSLGERFTLPGNSGFIDSVTLQIDSITSGAITVALFPDTLININGVGYCHVMNLDVLHTISDLNYAGYSSQIIQPGNIQWGVPTTVYFPHVAVPQSFFVAVTPDVSSGSIVNAFWWRSDREASHARTPDNMRSAFIAEDLQSGGVGSLLLDSIFVNQGQPLFCNFYATLYGSSGSSGVPIQLSSVHEAALYPNPATTILNIPASLQASDFELRDILGRTVLHSSEKNPAFADVRSLASGNYWAFMHTAGGIISTPVMIAR
jgi:hypothetical protein